MEQPVRITPATLDVLQVLLDEKSAVWGLRVVKATERPSGTVYPILERLERHGWLSSHWDEDESRRGPRRRLYELSTEGRLAAQRTVAASRRQTSPQVRPTAVRP